MEASSGLVAGSHNRNELVLIRGHEEVIWLSHSCAGHGICRVRDSDVLCYLHFVVVQPKPIKALNGQVCEICGDEVGVTVDGDLFVACNECGFPVCRPCYEYERREGNQLCPQCRTRYKRLKGICQNS